MRDRKIINENTYVYVTHISHEGNDVHDKMKFYSAAHIGTYPLIIVSIVRL